MQLLQSKKFPCEKVKLISFCNKGKRMATVWFAVLKPGYFSSFKRSNVFLMFYLLRFWIWFIVKLYISYEAVTWKLCLRHLLCPTALTLLAKAASPMQGGPPLDGGGRCLLGAGVSCALCSLSKHCHISCLCSVQYHVHTCFTEKL